MLQYEVNGSNKGPTIICHLTQYIQAPNIVLNNLPSQ